jgi:Nitrogenase molybdenum-iron protein, alpha and beta chains
MIDIDAKICRLSAVKSNEEIKSLSFAKFPGTHCPLFGVAMIASFISDMAVLVVGTGECTYYAKGFAYGNQKGRDNFYSLPVGKNEITFGCGKQVVSALHKIDDEDKPAAILVVTTCVLEVIGEDVESVIYEHRDDFNASVSLRTWARLNTTS